jgi:uncharacterized protein
MFIDIHCHAYRKPPPIYSFSTAEQVLERFDTLGIEKAALLPIVSPEIYLPQANEDILDMVEQYPDRFFAFCNIDPRALTFSSHAPLGDLLRYYKDKGCRGVGEVMPNLAVMDPMVQNLFRCAEEVGLPVTFDGSDQLTGDFGLYDDPGLPQLEHTLQRFPNLILFGHGPVFWTEIAKLETPAERGYVFRPEGGQVGRQPKGPIKEEGVMPKLMRLYPNLHGDLSDDSPRNALARDPIYGPKFLTEFQDRLCFGTDLCYPDMRIDIIALLLDWRETGKITEEVFQKVARENAVRIFQLA